MVAWWNQIKSTLEYRKQHFFSKIHFFFFLFFISLFFIFLPVSFFSWGHTQQCLVLTPSSGLKEPLLLDLVDHMVCQGLNSVGLMQGKHPVRCTIFLVQIVYHLIKHLFVFILECPSKFYYNIDKMSSMMLAFMVFAVLFPHLTMVQVSFQLSLSSLIMYTV